MIGGDGVDHAVFEALHDGFAVGFRAQRRRQLGEGAILTHGGFIKREVRRRSVAGDGQSAFLGVSDQADAFGGGNVREVQPSAGHVGQAQVALDHDAFRFAGNPGQP